MKKNCIEKQRVLVFIGLLFLSVSWLQAQWVTEHDYKFKINVPSNYSRTHEMDGTDKVYSFVRNDDNVLIRVRSTKVPPEVSTSQIQQVFESNYISNAQRILQQDGNLNGIPAKTAAYTWNVDGTPTVIGAYYLVKNGYAYIVWSLVAQSMVNELSKEVDPILETFAVLQNNHSGGGGLGSSFGNTPGQTSTQQKTPQNTGKLFKVTRIQLGNALSGNYQVAKHQTSFNTTNPEFFLVFDYEGDHKNMPFVIKWRSLTHNKTIDEVSLQPNQGDKGSGKSQLSMGGKPWPEGKYLVEFWHNNYLHKEIEFYVKARAAGISAATGSAANKINPDSYSFMYENVPPAHVKFQRPVNFTRNNVEPGQTIFGKNGNTTNNWTNLVVQVIARGPNGYASFDAGVADMKGQVANDPTMKMKYEHDFTLGGVKAARYDYAINSPGMQAVKCELAVDVPDVVLFISYVTLEKNYAEARYLIEHVVNTLNITKKQTSAWSGNAQVKKGEVATINHAGIDFSTGLKNADSDGNTVNWSMGTDHPQYANGSYIWWHNYNIKHYGEVNPNTITHAPAQWDGEPFTPLLNGHTYVIKCKDGYARIKVVATAPHADQWPAKVEYDFFPTAQFN